jgi:Flp pilus assembly protein TadG
MDWSRLVRRLPTRLVSSLRELVSGEDDSIRGASAIEFAIIAPVLIAAIISTIDIGMGLYRDLQVQNAAQAGAQYAALHGFSATDISNAVTNATSYSGISASPAPTQFCGCASTSGISAANCGSQCPGGVVAGTYVTASAQSTYRTILPYPVIQNTYALSAQSTLRIQ